MFVFLFQLDSYPALRAGGSRVTFKFPGLSSLCVLRALCILACPQWNNPASWDSATKLHRKKKKKRSGIKATAFHSIFTNLYVVPKDQKQTIGQTTKNDLYRAPDPSRNCPLMCQYKLVGAIADVLCSSAPCLLEMF